MNDGKCFLFFLFLWAFTTDVRCRSPDHSRLQMFVESGKRVQSTKQEYTGVTTIKLITTPAVTMNYSVTVSPFHDYNDTPTTPTAKDIHVIVSATGTSIQLMNNTTLTSMNLITNAFVPERTNQSALSTAAPPGKLTMKNTKPTSMNLTKVAFVTITTNQSTGESTGMPSMKNTKLTFMNLTTEVSVTKRANQSSSYTSASLGKIFTTSTVKNINTSKKDHLLKTNKTSQSNSIGHENGTIIGQSNQTHTLTSDGTTVAVSPHHHVASETNLGERILIGFEKKEPLTISLVVICGSAPVILVMLISCIIRRRRRSKHLVVDDTYQDAAARIFRTQGKQSAQNPRSSGNHASIDFTASNLAKLNPKSKMNSINHHVEIHEEYKDYEARDFLDDKQVAKQQITKNGQPKDDPYIDHTVMEDSSTNDVDISNSLNETTDTIETLSETTQL